MGLITGVYDAKEKGFVPGGASLHNSMSGHGPDADTFGRASAADTSKPAHVENTMAFMFETRRVLHPTRRALESPALQSDYYTCWRGLERRFDPASRDR
jgi:homogentisate 1,2-dioxygenase